MNDKEKQIEEIAKTMCEDYGTAICQHECEILGDCANSYLSKKLYEAGYRKQSDVAENIIAMLKAAKPVVKVHFEAYDELIENIAAEYGVEVEE